MGYAWLRAEKGIYDLDSQSVVAQWNPEDAWLERTPG